MAAQHTPGPWLVNPLNAWVEVPDADAPICSMLWPTDLRGEDETYANARLIASAPDMAEELRQLRVANANLKLHLRHAQGRFLNINIALTTYRGKGVNEAIQYADVGEDCIKMALDANGGAS